MNSPVIASFGSMFYKINVLRKLVIAESPVYIQYKVFINAGDLENVLKHSQHLIGMKHDICRQNRRMDLRMETKQTHLLTPIVVRLAAVVIRFVFFPVYKHLASLI